MRIELARQVFEWLRRADEEEFRRIVGKMTRLKNGKLLCNGQGCHSVYEPAEVIDPANDDYKLWVETPK